MPIGAVKSRGRRDDDKVVLRRAPVHYNSDQMQEILDRVSLGETLQQVCRTPGMPVPRTVYFWIRNDPEVYKRWQVAKELKSHSLFEEVISLARELAKNNGKDANLNQTRALSVAIDALKDAAGKLNPREYGPKQTQQTVIPIQIVTNMNLGQDGPPMVSSGDDIYSIEIPQPRLITDDRS